MKKMAMDYRTFSLIVAVLAAHNDCICESLKLRGGEFKDLGFWGATAECLLKLLLGKKNFLHLVGMFKGYGVSLAILPHGNSNEMVRQLLEMKKKGEIVTLPAYSHRPARKVRIYHARKKVRK